MYAGIVVVALLGYALNRLFVALANRALAWHRGMTAKGAS
jgi:ABC-type nitrate/sulfonate/bicarbonate transport system permease component